MSVDNSYKFPKETGVSYSESVIQFFSTINNSPGLTLVKSKNLSAANFLLESIPNNVLDSCFEVLPSLKDQVPFTHVLFTHSAGDAINISLMDERTSNPGERLVAFYTGKLYDYSSPQISQFYNPENSNFKIDYPDYKQKKYFAGDVGVINRGSNLGMLMLYLVDIVASQNHAYRMALDLGDDGYIGTMLNNMGRKLYSVPNAFNKNKFAYFYNPAESQV